MIFALCWRKLAASRRIVALPVAAVLLVFGRRLVDAYLSTDVYNAD